MNERLFLTYFRNGVESLGVQIDDKLYTCHHRLPSLNWLLTNAEADEIVERVLEAQDERVEFDPDQLRLVLGQQEIWAAGVTYKRSEEARERESNQSNVYTRVYHAERPELFFKAMGYDVVSSGDLVGIRHDAVWSVPEPELAIVLNARMQVVGFTIGNDMSSRDIEGANPLYLPQAKVYEASCAIGPRLWLLPNAPTYPDVTIELSIRRGDAIVFRESTSTANLNRTLPDLVDYLGRCKRFKHGAVLLTGTGIIPPDEFTLAAGDEVSIRIDPIGALVNRVTVIESLH
jgi:2-dehydro-3-deoxy-D-arabinonate dehydratase